MTRIEEHKSLKHYNTFGLEVYADYYTVIKSLQDFIELLQLEAFKTIPKMILGGGSNVLFTSNFKGLVIHNQIEGKRVVNESEDKVWVEAFSGENWHELVLFTIKSGWSGLENLSLIPGSVGAAPIQNIGAYGVELCDVFYELKALRLSDLELVTFSKRECNFDYRDSTFKQENKNLYFIYSVSLQLSKNHYFKTEYGDISDIIKQNYHGILSLENISNAVIYIRQSKLPNPKIIGNAGSFFKNPIVSIDTFEAMKNNFPEMPFFKLSESAIKIPAGWLIEKAGWKGKKIGEVATHDKQALVIINLGNATGKEIMDFAQQIQYEVKQKFNILLMPEVNWI